MEPRKGLDVRFGGCIGLLVRISILEPEKDLDCEV